jgi:hypothetical protein
MYSEMLQKGEKVSLYNLDHSESWNGEVSRINPKVDLTTQTIKVYIELSDKNLKEGMYLEANLTGKVIDDAFEVERKLLVDNSKMYVVVDSVLYLEKVTPIFYNKKTVIVKGLKDKQLILKDPVPGAFEGMIVKENTESQLSTNK